MSQFYHPGAHDTDHQLGLSEEMPIVSGVNFGGFTTHGLISHLLQEIPGIDQLFAGALLW